MNPDPTNPNPTNPDLARAVVERALVRTARSAALGGLALGLLAVTFLVLADGTLDARSLPQVLLLGCGQIVGLVAAGLAVNGLRRAATAQPWEVAHSVATQLSRALIVLTGIAPIIAIGCLVLVRPLTLTALSVLLSMAILAQLAIVLITVRGKLRRAAQSRRTR